ncbi:MAG: DUF881 domain-containing protein [Actinobacteria bacterium]|nr:DUF881 domain-containing protein [Actinomycetota bacterium]
MTSRTPTDTDASLSLLRRLVDDALDPGYHEAADRGDRRGADWRHSVAFGFAIAVTAALAVAAVLQVRAGAPGEGRTRAELTERVRVTTASVEAMDARLGSLNSEVDALRLAALDGSSSDGTLAEEVSALEAEVGVTAVEGPGVEVVMDDGPPAPVDENGPDLARVLDTDIQLVVNGLFAAEADAVAVNGQRITALSPIRSAGEAVLVGFRPLVPPYTIVAVGPAGLASSFESGQARAELGKLEAAYGIRVDVVPEENLSVPGRGDLQLRYVTKGESP